jgi:large subunit ribosomal protein L15
MQLHNLKLKNKRKKKKIIGRGGKKGTYCGKGMKGQKARSGAHVNPLFEGGRSTLIDHMKKKRGFKSLKAKKAIVKLAALDKKFKDGDEVNAKSLISLGLVDKMEALGGIKILGGGEIKKKFHISKDILLSSSSLRAIEKAGGKITKEQGIVNKEQ